MKKFLLGLTAVVTVGTFVLVAFGSSAYAGTGTQNDPFGPGDKVTFCHYDGSDQEGGGGSGKYNMPNASTTATGPAGHIGHAFDVIPAYWFKQNQNSQATFYGGVNWPTLTNLPSSPIDFTPLLGSSAATFIAGGCAAPAESTTTTTPITSTSTKPPETTTTTTPVTTTTVVTTTTTPVTTTTTPPVHTTTTAPPVTTTTTTAPPPVGAPPNNPPGNPNPHPHNPPNNPPTPIHTVGTAFTGAEDVLPMTVIAASLLLLGVGLLLASRKFKLHR